MIRIVAIEHYGEKRAGRKQLRALKLKEDIQPDIIIANGEDATGGLNFTEKFSNSSLEAYVLIASPREKPWA